MFRHISLAVVLAASATAAAAQQATPAPDYTWSRVQALRAGTSLHVSIKHHTRSCKYKSSTADSLECTHGDTDTSYARADVLKVAIAHRGRSALVGALPGISLGVGGAIAAAHECRNNDFLCGLGGAFVSAFGGLLVPIGAGVGYGADFTRSTIYKAP